MLIVHTPKPGRKGRNMHALWTKVPSVRGRSLHGPADYGMPDLLSLRKKTGEQRAGRGAPPGEKAPAESLVSLQKNARFNRKLSYLIAFAERMAPVGGCPPFCCSGSG